MNTKTVIILSLISLVFAIPQERVRNIFENAHHDPQKSPLQALGIQGTDLGRQAGLPFRNLFHKPQEIGNGGNGHDAKLQQKIEGHSWFRTLNRDSAKIALPLSISEIRKLFRKQKSTEN